MRKTYYIRLNRNGRQFEIRLRAWAIENQDSVPNYGFIYSKDDHPINHHVKNLCER